MPLAHEEFTRVASSILLLRAHDCFESFYTPRTLTGRSVRPINESQVLHQVSHNGGLCDRRRPQGINGERWFKNCPTHFQRFVERQPVARALWRLFGEPFLKMFIATEERD